MQARGRGREKGREGKYLNQPPCYHCEPDSWLHPMALRSWYEHKSRVSSLTTEPPRGPRRTLFISTVFVPFSPSWYNYFKNFVDFLCVSSLSISLDQSHTYKSLGGKSFYAWALCGFCGIVFLTSLGNLLFLGASLRSSQGISFDWSGLGGTTLNLQF